MTEPADASGVEQARRLLRDARGVVVFTGAGVSAESGVPTFRDADGIWARFRPEEVATPQAFEHDPRFVWEWYAMRRDVIARCQPNPAHHAIARFAAARDDVTVVTQNVDGLHERAALEAGDEPGGRLLHLHGSLFHVRCTGCGREERSAESVDASSAETLPHCDSCGGLLRPAVVWFGEMLPERELEAAFAAAEAAQVCLAVGTSALVYPAAGIPLATAQAGGAVIEVNPEATALSAAARLSLRGGAGELLPDLLDGA